MKMMIIKQLNQYIVGEISLIELEKALTTLLQNSTVSVIDVLATLEELLLQKEITESAYKRLCAHCRSYTEQSKVTEGRQNNSEKEGVAQSKTFQEGLNLFQSAKVSEKELLQILYNDLLNTPYKLIAYQRIVAEISHNNILPESTCLKLEHFLTEFDTNKDLAGRALTSSRQNESALQDENIEEQSDDSDKTVIRAKAVSNTSNAVQAQSSAPDFDTDKTVIKGRAVDNDEKTRIGIPSNNENTTPTSNTSGTSSTWSKSFTFQDREPLQLGDILNNRYKLIAFIDRGGMGDVFRAIDLDLETEIAVKVLNNEFRNHPDSLKTLRHETLKTRELNHDHIINVFSLEKDEFNAFMTMEFMEGEPLKSAIKKNPQGFPLDLAKRYIVEIAEALRYAHKEHLIHSDLKPGNIFLTDKKIKVFDFGIARAASYGHAKENLEFDAASLQAYTPEYASPEMIQRGLAEADPRDDIYALGCIAYELLTGKHPFYFEGEKLEAVEAQDKGLKPAVVEGLKKWQQKALENCLNFKRELRTPTIEAFLEEFQMERRPITNKQIAVATGGTLAGIAMVFSGIKWWEQHKIDQFKALIDEQKHAQLFEMIKEHAESDIEEITNLIEEDAINTSYRKYLVQRTDELLTENDFTGSMELMALSGKMLPDSKLIADLLDKIQEEKKQRILELDEKIVQFTQNPTVDEFNQFLLSWNLLAKVAPESHRLTNIEPALNIQDKVLSFQRNLAFEEAKDLAENALSFYQATPVFDAYIPKIKQSITDADQAIKKQKIDKEISSYEVELGYLIDVNELASFDEHLETIKRISLIAPQYVFTAQLLGNLTSLIKQDIEHYVEAKEFSYAEQLISRYQGYIPENVYQGNVDSIGIALDSYNEEVNSLQSEINKLIWEFKLTNAQDKIASLSRLKVRPEQIEQAYLSLSKAWLSKARKHKNAYEWDAAIDAISQGKLVPQAESQVAMFEAEIRDIETLQKQIKDQQQEAQFEELRKQKLKRIAAIEASLDSLMNESEFTNNVGMEILRQIDELGSLNASEQKIERFKTALINRYLTEINTLSKASLEDAKRMAKISITYMPGEASLLSKLSDLEARIEQEGLLKKEKALEKRFGELEGLLQGSLTNQIAFDVKAKINDFATTFNNEAKAVELNSMAATAFISLAEKHLENQQFNNAEKAIAHAKSFSANPSLISSLSKSVQDAKSAYENEQQQRREEAKLGSLKQSFITQIQALNVYKADLTFEAIKKDFPEEIEFLNTVATTEYGKAYLTLAGKEIDKSAFSKALSFVNEGIARAPKSNELLQLKVELTQAIDVSQLSASDPEQARTQLNKLRGKYPQSVVFNKINISEKRSSQPINSAGVACLMEYAGKGKSCYDMLSDTFKGPRLVVLPSFKGKNIAVTRYEIRNAEYNFYCEQSGKCVPHTGGDNFPVTGLALGEVQEYVNWMSQTTSATYRIPTEDEWMYAANAEGESQQKAVNCKVYAGGILQNGYLEYVNTNGQSAQNAWAVRNYLGNVSELVISPSGYEVRGGSFNNQRSECSIGWSRKVGARLEDDMGLRLIREL